MCCRVPRCCCCFYGIFTFICKFIKLIFWGVAIFAALSIVFLISGVLGLIISTQNDDIANGLEKFSSSAFLSEHGPNITKEIMKIVFPDKKDYENWLESSSELFTPNNGTNPGTKFSDILFNSNISSFQFWKNVLFSSDKWRSSKMSLFSFVLYNMPKRVQLTYTFSGLIGVTIVICIFMCYCCCCTCCTFSEYCRYCKRSEKIKTKEPTEQKMKTFKTSS